MSPWLARSLIKNCFWSWPLWNNFSCICNIITLICWYLLRTYNNMLLILMYHLTMYIIHSTATWVKWLSGKSYDWQWRYPKFESRLILKFFRDKHCTSITSCLGNIFAFTRSYVINPDYGHHLASFLVYHTHHLSHKEMQHNLPHSSLIT